MASTTKTVKVGDKNVILDASVANAIEKTGKIYHDISNNSFKFYNNKTHETTSLATAVVMLAKKTSNSERITRRNKDGANYTLKNLNY